MRTVEEMKKTIIDWEEDMGEDFLDYFNSYMNFPNLMFWAFGSGYISKAELNAWEADLQSMASESELLLGGEEYSIVKEDDFELWLDAVDKAYTILAEFLSSSTTYQRRVEEFVSNISQVNFDEALKALTSSYYRVYYELNGERILLQEDTPLDYEIITGAKWYKEELQLR